MMSRKGSRLNRRSVQIVLDGSSTSLPPSNARKSLYSDSVIPSLDHEWECFVLILIHLESWVKYFSINSIPFFSLWDRFV